MIPYTMYSSLPKELIDATWEKVKDSKGLWACLEGESYEAFLLTLSRSAYVISIPFGFVRVSNYVPEVSARLHGIFWSKAVFYNIDSFLEILENIQKLLRVVRLEVIVPTNAKSLNRLVKALHFELEGTMKKWYYTGKTYLDANLYAKVW